MKEPHRNRFFPCGAHQEITMQQRSAFSIKKDLRKHSTPWSNMKYVDIALEELNTESDSGTMLLIETQLEDALAHYISVKLPGITKSEDGGFLGPEGPAGAFGVKIKLALGMGILNRRAFDALEIIRHIRNAGAHSHPPGHIRHTHNQGSHTFGGIPRSGRPDADSKCRGGTTDLPDGLPDNLRFICSTWWTGRPF